MPLGFHRIFEAELNDSMTDSNLQEKLMEYLITAFEMSTGHGINIFRGSLLQLRLILRLKLVKFVDTHSKCQSYSYTE
jgi:hypothetical protein